MKIGIIGTGRMGSGLGKRWANAGHQAMFGSRDPAKARQVAAELGANASGGSYQDAVPFADVLLFTIPWTATEETLRELGSLDGKILIETTNNFSDKNPVSTTERIMSWVPGAKVVKAFNGVFQQILHTDPAAAQSRADVLFAGDDADAKQVASQLIADAGFNAVDMGPASNAHHVEKWALLIIELANAQGMGTNIGLKIVKV